MTPKTVLLAGIGCLAGCAALDTETYLMQVVTENAAPAPRPRVPTRAPTPAPTLVGTTPTPEPTHPGVPCACWSCFNLTDGNEDGFLSYRECCDFADNTHNTRTKVTLAYNCTTLFHMYDPLWDLTPWGASSTDLTMRCEDVLYLSRNTINKTDDFTLSRKQFEDAEAAVLASGGWLCTPPTPPPSFYNELCCDPGFYEDPVSRECVECFGGATPVEIFYRGGLTEYKRMKCEKELCDAPSVDFGHRDTCGSLEEATVHDTYIGNASFQPGGGCEIPLSRTPSEVGLKIGSTITLTQRGFKPSVLGPNIRDLCGGCPFQLFSQDTVSITKMSLVEDTWWLTVSPCPCGNYTAGDEVVHTCDFSDGTYPNPSHRLSSVRDTTGGWHEACQCGMNQCTQHQSCWCPQLYTQAGQDGWPASGPFGKVETNRTECGINTNIKTKKYPDGQPTTGWINGFDLHPADCCRCIDTEATPGPSVAAKGDPHLVNLQGEHFDINHEGEFTLLRIPQDVEKTAEIQLKGTVTTEYRKPCTTFITQAEVSGKWLGNTSVQVRCYRKYHPGAVDGAFLGARMLGEGHREVPWSGIEAFLSDERELALSTTSQTEVTLSKSQWFPNKRGTAKEGPAVAGMFTVSMRNQNSQLGAKLVIRQDLPEQEHLNVVVQRLSALGRVDVGGLLGFDEHPQTLEQISADCYAHRATSNRRVESQEDNEYSYKPVWKERWEKHRAQKSHQAAPEPSDPMSIDAAASLMGHGRTSVSNMMCLCPKGDDEFAEGVLVEAMTARFAEASWD